MILHLPFVAARVSRRHRIIIPVDTTTKRCLRDEPWLRRLVVALRTRGTP